MPTNYKLPFSGAEIEEKLNSIQGNNSSIGEEVSELKTKVNNLEKNLLEIDEKIAEAVEPYFAQIPINTTDIQKNKEAIQENTERISGFQTSIDDNAFAINTIITNLGDIKLRKLTIEVYNSLTEKDPNTLYIITN